MSIKTSLDQESPYDRCDQEGPAALPRPFTATASATEESSSTDIRLELDAHPAIYETENPAIAGRYPGSQGEETETSDQSNTASEELRRPMGKTWAIDDPELEKVLRRMVGAHCPTWFTSGDRGDVYGTIRVRLEKMRDPGGKNPEFNSTFLGGTVINVLREVNRKKKKLGAEVPIEDENNNDAAYTDKSLTPVESVITKEKIQTCWSCRKKIPRKSRRLLFLFLIGWKIPEIAHRFCLPPKEVDNRVYRGRDTLLECLEKKGIKCSSRKRKRD